MYYMYISWAAQLVQVVKNPPASIGDIGDTGSIPGLGRSPGRGHGNPLQYYWGKLRETFWRDGEGQRSLECCSPWGREESDTTEQQQH